MSNSTTLQSPRQKAGDSGQSYSHHTTNLSSGRRLVETIQEEEEMSDSEGSSAASRDGSDTGEYDTEDTQRPNGNGHTNGHGNGHPHSETAGSIEEEDSAEYPSSPPQNSLSSWAELDLSVLVALLSPIGQWLTGGDHIKNLFLIVLLVFYLHQLIQVPWELYRASLPRRSARPLPRAKGAKSRLLRLAESELRTHEHIYLMLTILSPLLGALFLRYTLTTITGVDHMSWFSTTLFVLATGTRPWSHLIDRLRTRTHELHDTIHYPSPESAFSAMRKLEVAMKRIEAMERELASIKGRVSAGVDVHVKEAFNDLNGGLEEVNMALQENQRKMEAAKTAQNKRIAALERNLTFLEERQQERLNRSHSSVPTITSTLFAVPEGVWARIAPGQASPSSPAILLSEKQQGKRKLETIPEDPLDLDVSNERPVPSKTPLPIGLSISVSPTSFFGLALAVLTWPLRLFIAVCSSLQRTFFPVRHGRHRR